MGIIDIFNAIIFEPLLNTLIYITGLVPGADIGIAIIALTVLVKLLILPLSHKSIKTQAKLKTIEPEVKKVREKHSKNQQQQAAEIMKLYRAHGINPFSGCLLALIQIPIIFGLYWVFWQGLQDGVVDPNSLYYFVQLPDIDFHFLGLLDLRESGNILLSFLAGASQFYQMRLSLPPPPADEPKKALGERSLSEELKRNFATQARYILPFIVAGASLGFPAAIPLYWSTSNIFSIGHELLVKRKAEHLVSESERPET